MAQACDLCGCFMGITPYDNQSGFALMHRYRIFNGYQATGQPMQFRPDGARIFLPSSLNSDNGYAHNHEGSADDFEAFRVIELRAKYFLSRRVELNAFLPYVMNLTLAIWPRQNGAAGPWLPGGKNPKRGSVRDNSRRLRKSPCL